MGSRSNERQSPAVSASDEARAVTIAGNPGVEVPAGTLNSVLKQAGLKV
jgi:predicted RNA binding protein YcfA (HicA-like mRNA interferase family)